MLTQLRVCGFGTPFRPRNNFGERKRSIGHFSLNSFPAFLDGRCVCQSHGRFPAPFLLLLTMLARVPAFQPYFDSPSGAKGLVMPTIHSYAAAGRFFWAGGGGVDRHQEIDLVDD